jgi:uncharacterized protein (DUF488 family)
MTPPFFTIGHSARSLAELIELLRNAGVKVAGLQTLRTLGHTRRLAIMCAEAVWWRCHRRIIADYFISAGETVCHILGCGKIELVHLTPAARPTPEGTLSYPRLTKRE